MYQSPVTEEEHLSNLIRLADDFTSKFPHFLKNKRFRIGIAQKALNLYLKYLWCADLISQPPHCPFDSIVINRLPNCSDLRWTSIDTIEDYQRLVQNARRVADGKSIAEWELEVWTDSIQTERIGGAIQGTERQPKGQIGRMPKKGDVFNGKINDLCNLDKSKWRRRDIWFFKHEVNRREIFRYPARHHKIILIDTDGHRYELNFSKPDYEDRVCLGTPSKLKPWYQKKGFDENAVAPYERVYFKYSGVGVEFNILTEQEYEHNNI